MIALSCVQGTDEWKAARCGIPSASNFDKIITTEGKPSKSRTKYLYQLAGERVAGVAEEAYQNAAMQRGTEMEAEARQLYQVVTDDVVKEVGFCVVDNKYGASPDGLVGENGLIEIKCPSLAVHVEYLMNEVLPTDYFQQVHGQLFVTGRDWCDFISYYPAVKPLIVRVCRDDNFSIMLENELSKFCIELDEIVKKIS